MMPTFTVDTTSLVTELSNLVKGQIESLVKVLNDSKAAVTAASASTSSAADAVSAFTAHLSNDNDMAGLREQIFGKCEPARDRSSSVLTIHPSQRHRALSGHAQEAL